MKTWLSMMYSAFVGISPAAAGVEMPQETGAFRPPDLVEVNTLDPTIRLDVRYATADNFVHRAVYPLAKAYLQRPAAEALVKAHQRLRPLGYGLLIFDGYRPWSVTRLFWNSVTEDKRLFVADPAQGSRHNRGCAVDLSLYDLATGKEVVMTSAYDEMNEKAYPDYIGGSAESRRLRDLLRHTMEQEGFSVYPTEWWHFDYRDWREYQILDLPFEALATRPK
jgi:D-alanyl-D-alanine dipeptidase